VSTLPESEMRELGYGVVLRYGREVTDEVEEFSRSVRNALGGNAIVYETSDVHQSLGSFSGGVSPKSEEVQPHRSVLEKLTEVTKNALFEFSEHEGSGTNNSFGNYSFNNNFVILEPTSIKVRNFTLMDKIREYGERAGLDIKAWGRHMTVSRFTDNVPVEEIGEFANLMYSQINQGLYLKNLFAGKTPSSKSIRIETPESVDVISFTADREDGFKIQVYESLEP
jgi:hypothetical protein